MKKLIFVFLLVVSFQSALAANIITAGTDAVSYKLGDNATISGFIRTTRNMPVASASMKLNIGAFTDTATSDSNGKFTFEPYSIESAGNYSFVVQQLGTPNLMRGIFSAATQKILYTVTTDSYTYSPGDNVTVSITAKYEDDSPVSSGSVDLKIKKETGETMYSGSVPITDGAGSYIYTTLSNSSAYANYIVVVGNSLAVTKFEIPSFDIRLSVNSPGGKPKYVFSSSETLVLGVTATITGSQGTKLPIKGASITTVLKTSAGVPKTSFTSFTETLDGFYESEEYSLANLSNGKYYIEVEVTKSGNTEKARIDFEIKSLRAEIAPISDMKESLGLLTSQENATLGLFVEDMSNGKELATNQFYNATITECRKSDWSTCSVPSGIYFVKESTEHFKAKLLFTTPSTTGQYYFKVWINTSSGEVYGDTWISVQNVIAYTETKDEFGMWRWRYGPGDKVKLHVKAVAGDWEDRTQNITSIVLEEVRDQDWNNITGNISATINNSQKTVKFNAPRTSGFYDVKIKLTMDDNSTAYARGGFEVALYDIWVDTKDADGNWQWQFGSSSNVFFHVNVREMGGSVISSSNIANIKALFLVNELTGKKYSNLRYSSNGTSTNPSGDTIPVLKLQLAGQGIASGFYHCELEITDVDGNTERAEAWFKVTDFNVVVNTLKATGEQNWQFGPSDYVNFTLEAEYFNGTKIENASVRLIRLMSMRMGGPPSQVSSTKYNNANATNTNSNGQAKLWLKPAPGVNIPSGEYSAIFNVTAGASSSLAEGWFAIRTISVSAEASQSYFSRDENISFVVTVTKMDGTPIENATVSLTHFRDTTSWNELNLGDYGLSNIQRTTNSAGKATITFAVPPNLNNGNYEAEFMVTSELGDSNTHASCSISEYIVSGWLITDPGKEYGVYTPGGDVKMQIQVYYPNGTSVVGLGDNAVTVYQLLKTESWPWTFKTATTTSSTEIGNGVYQVTVKAPQEPGWYNALANISGSASKDPWSLPSFQVRSLKVTVNLFGTSGSSDEFGPADNISAQISVSNPTGGQLTNISEVKLVSYKNIDTDKEITLGNKITSSSDWSKNNLTFTAPSAKGEYVLYVSVQSSTTLVTAKKWFSVTPFEFSFWMEDWSYSPEDTVQVHIHARNPDGSDHTVKVNATDMRNVWTDEHLTNFGGGESQITGEGVYNVTAPSDLGEYELELCIYTTNCTDSDKVWLGFSVATFQVHMWPEPKPTFTTDENATISIELAQEGGGSISPSNFNVSLASLRNDKTNQYFAITEKTFDEACCPPRKKLTFSCENLTEGGYRATLNVLYGSENRTMEAWFSVSGYAVNVNTVPPLPSNWWDNPLEAGLIAFNITTSPAQDLDGLLEIHSHDKNWETVDTKSFTLVNGSALVNVTIEDAGEYNAMVRVGDAENHRDFKVESFNARILWDQTSNEIGTGDNVTVAFQITDSSGDPITGNLSVMVKDIKRTSDWNRVSSEGTNVYEETMAYTGGTATFTFNPGDLSTGEYETEVLFTINGKTQKEHIPFQIRTIEFSTYHTEDSYAPGDNVTINTYLADKTGSPIEGAGISVVEIVKDHWEQIGYLFSIPAAITGSNGYATITISLPENLTGWIDVKLMENQTNSTNWMGFQVSGYSTRLEKDWSKWSYSPGDNYSSTLYVYDRNGAPASNASVKIKVMKEGQWDTPVLTASMPDTDSEGKSVINFAVPNESTQYNVEIIVKDGVAREHDWFKVESFMMNAWVQGESSGKEQLTPSDTAKISVQIQDKDFNSIQDAQVWLHDVKRTTNWQLAANYTPIEVNTTTDSMGMAEIRFLPPQTEGEYVAVVKAAVNGTQNEWHAWFKVTSSIITLRFICPIVNGSVVSCGDPRSVAAGGKVYVNVTGTGMITVKIREVENLKDNSKITYGDERTGNNSVVLNFTAPTEVSDYDAVFEFYKNGNFQGDVREWFRTRTTTGYEMDSNIEPHNAWAGENASVMIHLWDQNNWRPVTCEPGTSNFTITGIKDAWNWITVADGSEISQWLELNAMGGPGENTQKITFTVPASLNPGREFFAMITGTCNGQNIGEREAHFRISAFQVSSMMPQIVKTNETVPFWVKITDAGGTPIVNAIVRKERLMSDWEWREIKTYDEVYYTDENGEFIGSITSPNNPGSYVLELKVMNGTITQRIERWFMIEGLKMETLMQPYKGIYYINDSLVLLVNITDNQNNAISNANVEVMIHRMGGDGEMDGKGGDGGEYGPTAIGPDNETGPGPTSMSNNTNSAGIALFDLGNMTRTAGEYEMEIHSFDQERGDVSRYVSFVVRAINITADVGRDYSLGASTGTITVTAKDSEGADLDGLPITASLVKMAMKRGASETVIASENSTVSSGTATFNLTIPNNNSYAGPVLFLIGVYDSNNSLLGEEEYVLIVHHQGVQINVSGSNSVASREFIDLNISSSDTTIMMAPMMMHIQKIGESIPASKMMSMDMESQNWYESPIYLNPQGQTHIKAQARDLKGKYSAVIFFVQKGSDWFGPEDMYEIVFHDYEVVG